MQFRTSDRKTIKYFEEAGLTANIRYIDNFKVRTISTGQDASQAVIFIHGAPGSGDAFYSYLKHPELIKKAHLLTYDRPGYGYSDFGKAITSIEAQTQILVNIIEDQQLQNVILVGHSYGGPIAAYAPLLSEKIRAVIMLAPAIDPDREKYFWIGNLTQWKLTRWMTPTSFIVSADEKYTHEAELRALKDQWQYLDVPVVCLHGNKDRLVPYDNLAFCEKHFPSDHFTGISLEKEDHFIPWTQENLVIKEIMKFLTH